MKARRPARQSARGVAIGALVAVEDGARANEVLPALLAASGLDERDRSFATELVYGTVRMRRACDWLVDRFARRELEPLVRVVARAGAYQLAFMRVPSYAAVSATVGEGPERARPVLNAVLRRVGELVEPGPVPWPDLATRLSYPDWVVERLARDLGPQRALAALQQMDRPAAVSTRVDGYVQDLGSQAVCEHLARLLPPVTASHSGRWQHGPLVLDICAAPGGKATFLAASSALVVAADLSGPRVRRLAGNVSRLALGNVAVVQADATAAPFRPSSAGLVLLDAPCSGLGVLRRRPDARWRVSPEDVVRLAALQHQLLATGASLVARGGLLAYCVCTLTREETVGAEEHLLRELGIAGDRGQRASWEVVPPPGPPWEPWGRGALLLPQAAGTDGMYLLVLRRA